MARSLSWIDSDHLTALLEVVSPAGARESSRGGRSEGQDDEEPESLSALFDRLPERAPERSPGRSSERPPQPARAPAQTVKPATPARAPAQAPAPQQAPARAPASPPEVSPFTPSPGADLATRLEEFIEWVVGSTHLDAAFITDANGLLVVERGIGQVEPALTASIDLLLNHVSDVLQSEVDGYVALQHDGLHFVTLWTPTVYGRFYGVLLSRAAPHPESLLLAGQGFRTLFAN